MGGRGKLAAPAEGEGAAAVRAQREGEHPPDSQPGTHRPLHCSLCPLLPVLGLVLGLVRPLLVPLPVLVRISAVAADTHTPTTQSGSAVPMPKRRASVEQQQPSSDSGDDDAPEAGEFYPYSVPSLNLLPQPSTG